MSGISRGGGRWLRAVVLAALCIGAWPSSTAVAGRGGGSYGGRSGFSSSPSRSYGSSRSSGGYGGSSGFGSSRGYGGGYRPSWGSPVVPVPVPVPVPSYGYVPPTPYGYRDYGGPYAYRSGCGGGGTLFALLLVLVVVGVVAMRARRRGGGGFRAVDTEQGWVLRLQLAYSHTAALQLQKRLLAFAETGDTSSVAGLARLLHETALELLRHADSVAQAALRTEGPLDLAATEQRFGAQTMEENARFDRSRIRAVDGRVQRDATVEPESLKALEFVVVSLVVATRTQPRTTALASEAAIRAVLQEVGSIPASSLLAFEVIWTPADATDSLTNEDLITAFPDLAPV